MALFDRFKKQARSRDRPAAGAGTLTPLWAALAGSKSRNDLRGSEAIYAAVGRISHTMACMPLHLYCNHEIQMMDPREQLVSYAPNGSLMPYHFKLAIEACRNTAGRAYVMIVPGADGLSIDRLDVLDPARVQPLRNTDNGEIWYQIALDNGEQVTVHNSYVIALFHMSTDGVTGISPIDVLSGTLNYDAKVRDVSVSQLEGIKDSIVLTFPTGLSKEKREEHTNAFLDAYRRSRGNLIVLDSGITADKITGSLVDTHVLDVDNITKRKVATVYNMPPRMLGDGQASGYSTSEQDMAEFLKLTIQPIVKQWEETFNRKLLTYKEVCQGYGFRFDMAELERGDTNAMSEKHAKAIRSGNMSPNEARREDGLPPKPFGDELLMSRDLIPVRVAVEHPELLLTGKVSGSGDE